jgi:16S rRNA processing protein rimM
MNSRAFTVPTLSDVGYLGKPHGVHGEIIAYLTIDLRTLCREPSNDEFYIFVEIESLPVPYRLLKYRNKGESYLLTLSRVSDRSTAETMTGWRLLVPTAELADNQVAYSWDHFIDYQVYSPAKELIGTIVNVNDQTENVFLLLKRLDGSQQLLPIHEELVDDIDPEHKTLQLQIPNGLLDL